MKWEIVKLGDYINILSGYPFESSLFNDTKGKPVIRIRDVKRGYTNTYYDGKVDSNYIITKGDILVGMDGEFNAAIWSSEPALLNQRVCKITSKDKSKLSEDYLIFFLPKKLKEIEDRTSFATVKHLSVKGINNIDIPLPSFHIQEKIADTLKKADALRRKDQELLTKYDKLAHAIFYDMFGDPKDGLEKWGKVKLKEVCTKITDGEHGTVERLEEGKLYLMARNIRDNYIDLDEVSYISQADHNKIYKRCNPEFQDLLLVCVGATIGRASLVPNMEEFSLARSVALIKPNRLKVDPIFLYSFFKTDFMQKQIAVSGNSSAQAGLYTGKISDLELFLPPITLQKDYNKKITNILKQKSIVIKNSDSSSKLFNGTMKMYFS